MCADNLFACCHFAVLCVDVASLARNVMLEEIFISFYELVPAAQTFLSLYSLVSVVVSVISVLASVLSTKRDGYHGL